MHRRLFFAVFVTVLLAALSPSSASSAAPAANRLPTPDRRPSHAADRLLVRFAKGVAAVDAADVVRGHGFRMGKAVGRTGFTVVETGSVRAETARDRLRGVPGVEAVELDVVRRMAATPNDTHYATYQYPLRRVGFPAAWDIVKASAAQRIAVIDTGVDLAHPDLVGKVLAGYDFVDDDVVPQDENGHGTMVAGIAAANTNNNRGMAGASWGASVMPLRALDADGNGFDSDIAAAVDWAVLNGATVINLSLGGPGYTTALQTAIANAAAADVVVVAATGNDGLSEPSYPAAFPSVLAVGATDNAGDLVYFSNHGAWVDLAAPGVGILGPVFDTTGYNANGVGTSFASPIVAGAAAMVRTWDSALTAAAVVDRLQATAQDNGPVGKDTSYGWGVLDVSAAVGGAAAADIAPQAGDSYEPNDTSGTPAVLAASATATISPEADVDWYAVDVAATGVLSLTVTPPFDQSSWLGMDPVVAVYAPSGALVGSADAKGVDEAESLSVTASAVGRYRVRITSAGGARSPGSYSFTFSAPTPPATTTTTTATTTTTTTAPTAPPQPLPRTDATRSGYWMVDAGGHVYAFGQAGHHGGLNGARTNVVDLEPTPTGNGYWLLTSAGEIFTFGDARHVGQPSSLAPGELVTSMSAHPGGSGYWVFTTLGRVVAYGGAPHKGSMYGTPLNGPVLDSVATPSGNGYFMVASDGGIFAFGDAVFRGSMGGKPLNGPVQSLVPDRDNDGYWLVATDGGVFAFNAAFRGSMGGKPLNRAVTGMVRFGDGYLMVGEDGGIFNFSNQPFFGSLGSNPPALPVVAVAALDQ